MGNIYGRLRGGLLQRGVLVLGLCGAVLFTTVACGAENNAAGPKATQNQFDTSWAKMREEPENAALLSLEQLFPADFAKWRSELIGGASGPGTSEEAYNVSRAWMRNFVRGHALDAAKAPDDTLNAWLEANLQLVTALSRENTQACADFGMRGSMSTASFSPAARAYAGRMGVRTIEAIRAGLDHPVARPAQLSDADQKGYERAMVQSGLTEPLLNAVRAPNPSAQSECEFAVIMYKAPTLMPRDQAARVVSTMLAHSSPQPTGQ